MEKRFKRGEYEMSGALQEAVMIMLKEGFEGPTNPQETWFTNNKPDSGIFGALKGASHREASTSVNGTTLAGHANHIRYHMWGTNEFIRSGTYPKMDWDKSWEPSSVGESSWVEVQEQLRSEYMALISALDATEWNQAIANEVMASLSHSAYHLGAIRQILKVAKTG
ncbi:hypothetical protein GI364_24290 [Alicyclobacillus sp. SO9]|nr:hypothetical protein GI364_24290 [Alicyclobacillus sp. SO9]